MQVSTSLQTELTQSRVLNASVRDDEEAAQGNSDAGPIEPRSSVPALSIVVATHHIPRHAVANATALKTLASFCFRNDDGTNVYYATFTDYDGKVIMPELIETSDFLLFRFVTLNGPAAENKGMAIFPRKISGRYAMLSRQDNENIYLMFSDDIHF
jgi:hypothetical protein